MALLMIMFTERYLRELYCVYQRKELLIWINWIEAFIFFTYVVYSVFTTCNHIYYLVEELKEESGHENAKEVGAKSLEQKFAVEMIEIFIHLYIIFDKASHFLHSGHSISLYLSKAAHIPKMQDVSHGHEHLASDLQGESYVSDEEEKKDVMKESEMRIELEQELLDTSVNPADRIIE